jgi:large subunit ribosomal protein L3
MLNTILGTKKRMSQTFVEGTRVPVTYVKAGPCTVTHIKKIDMDGYWAVQLGFGEKRIKNVTKPLQGHLKGAIKDKKAPRFLREVRLKDEPKLEVGDQVKVSNIFKKGDVVSVTGVSKGKGFAGVVKRWGFKGGPRTHGQSDRLRAPGSIGQGTTPGRVHKGKKMAGRMGGDTVTIKNLIVVDVDEKKSLLTLSGPIPGVPGSLLIIKKLASGKLDELIQEAPAQQIVEGEPEPSDASASAEATADKKAMEGKEAKFDKGAKPEEDSKERTKEEKKE